MYRVYARRAGSCDQDKRISSTEALRHPWIVGDASELEKRDLRKNMEQFRLFNARRKFKSSIGSVSTRTSWPHFLFYFVVATRSKLS